MENIETKRELSYVMVKPIDANDTDKIINIYRELFHDLKDYNIEVIECGYTKFDKEHADTHYQEHVKKSWYAKEGGLQNYITSDKVFGTIIAGNAGLRKAIRNVVEGKFREKYQRTNLTGEDKIQQNVLHASACVKDEDMTASKTFNDIQERAKDTEALNECKNFLLSRATYNEKTLPLTIEEQRMRTIISQVAVSEDDFTK